MKNFVSHSILLKYFPSVRGCFFHLHFLAWNFTGSEISDVLFYITNARGFYWFFHPSCSVQKLEIYIDVYFPNIFQNSWMALCFKMYHQPYAFRFLERGGVGFSCWTSMTFWLVGFSIVDSLKYRKSVASSSIFLFIYLLMGFVFID